jgi:membrane protease YdiL (CAAX protease family)
MVSHQWRVVLAVVAGLVAMDFTGTLARALPLPGMIDSVPYARSGLSYLIDIAATVTLLRLLGGLEIGRQWIAAGLGKPWRPAALMGLCLFAPIMLAGMLFGKVASDITWPSLAFLGVLGPLAEEVTYRGLATGVLLAFAGWRFWPAALLPAAVFGLLHAAQGDGLAEMAGVVAITGAGGVFFSWLYVRFGGNLWPAIVMHVGMNAAWSIYDLGDNAIGGLLGNVLRAASVLGAVAITLWGQHWLARATRTANGD